MLNNRLEQSDYHKIVLDFIWSGTPIDFQWLRNCLPIYLQYAAKEQQEELMNLAAQMVNYNMCKLLIENGIPFVGQALDLFDVSYCSREKFGMIPLEELTRQVKQWKLELIEYSNLKCNNLNSTAEKTSMVSDANNPQGYFAQGPQNQQYSDSSSNAGPEEISQENISEVRFNNKKIL